MHPENIYKNGLDLDIIYRTSKEARYWLYLNENGKAKMLNLPGQEAFFTQFLLKRELVFEVSFSFIKKQHRFMAKKSKNTVRNFVKKYKSAKCNSNFLHITVPGTQLSYA